MLRMSKKCSDQTKPFHPRDGKQLLDRKKSICSIFKGEYAELCPWYGTVIQQDLQSLQSTKTNSIHAFIFNLWCMHIQLSLIADQSLAAILC